MYTYNRCYGVRMSKRTIYLPDDLAAAVDLADLNVSDVCQTALRVALLRISDVDEADLCECGNLSDLGRSDHMCARCLKYWQRHYLADGGTEQYADARLVVQQAKWRKVRLGDL